jgi:PAS domain S-box-containing protein
MDRSDEQRAGNVELARGHDAVNKLIDKGLGSTIDRMQRDWFTKVAEAEIMEKNVAQIGASLMHYRRTLDAKYRTEYTAKVRELQEALGRFRALRLTGDERFWAKEVQSAFADLSRRIDLVTERDRRQADDLARFTELRRELDAAYEEIRIPTEAGLAIAKDSTHQSLNALFVTLTILIAGGVITGVGSALALTSAITRTERSLREQREEFRVTLASIGDGVIVIDRNSHVRFMNDIAESLTGWKVSAAIGKDLSEIFRIIDGVTRRELADIAEPTALLSSMEGPTLSRSALLVRGKKEIAIEYSAAPISGGYDELHGVVVVFRDISLRKQAEDAIKLSESRYRSLVTSVSEMVWTADVDGSFRAPQSSWQAVTGQTWDEARGLGWTSALHPDDREAFTAAWLGSVREKTPFEAEGRIWHAGSGKYRYYRVRATPVFHEGGALREWTGMCADITEQWRAEAALRESEERFRLMADAAPVLIWVADTRKLCTYFNKGWLDFTGRTLAHELGNGWTESVHPDDLAGCLEAYRAAFDERKPFRMEFRLRRADGEYRWILNQGTPRFSRAGTFSGYIGSCIDITERRRAEETLRDADRRKDEFLAILGHELRNPLATIQNALHVLTKSDSKTPQIEHVTEMMGRQAELLGRLVDDLLEVSRVTHGKIELRRERLDLLPVVTSAIEATAPLIASREHTLSTALPFEPIAINADRVRLEQALTNLLSNAAKYTPHGGRIWLTVSREGDDAVISVHDTGIGIAPDMLPQIFDSFQQVHPPEGPGAGLGIGLTLARHLIELHGGRMEARSAGVGLGSEFIVRLPAFETVPQPVAAGAGITRGDNGAKAPPRHILIVEDNLDGAASLAMLLEMLGHDVEVAHDGPAALLTTKRAHFDFVLLDIGLPEMNGYEVAARLRERDDLADTTLIAMTGYGQEKDKQRARRAGFDCFLTKPVDMTALNNILAGPRRATSRLAL